MCIRSGWSGYVQFVFHRAGIIHLTFVLEVRVNVKHAPEVPRNNKSNLLVLIIQFG